MSTLGWISDPNFFMLNEYAVSEDDFEDRSKWSDNLDQTLLSAETLQKSKLFV